MIRLSVIIPCYNMGEFLPDAIASVEQYKGDDIEMLIMNDGSTDPATITLLQELERKGYNVINQQNQGLAMARNNAIAICKGEYFLPLDADNKIRPAYIEKGIKILDKYKDVAVVYGDSLLFGEKQGVKKSQCFDLLTLMRGNYIDACVVARKEAWKQVGGYDKNISPLADWDFHISVAEAGWKLYYISEVLFDYRVRNDSMIKTYNKQDDHINYVVKKHSALYRKMFMYQASLKGQLRLLFRDLWLRVTGKYR
jgi:glycosyltransferase involved in cell wall biosynthesis